MSTLSLKPFRELAEDFSRKKLYAAEDFAPVMPLSSTATFQKSLPSHDRFI